MIQNLKMYYFLNPIWINALILIILEENFLNCNYLNLFQLLWDNLILVVIINLGFPFFGDFFQKWQFYYRF